MFKIKEIEMDNETAIKILRLIKKHELEIFEALKPYLDEFKHKLINEKPE